MHNSTAMKWTHASLLQQYTIVSPDVSFVTCLRIDKRKVLSVFGLPLSWKPGIPSETPRARGFVPAKRRESD